MTRIPSVCLLAITVAFAVCLAAAPVGAQLKKGDTAPAFKARDIHGNEVDLAQIIEQQPDLVILYFFTVNTGEEIARRLQLLHSEYGADKINVIALGLEEDEAALREFAQRWNIDYYILPNSPELDAENKYGPFQALPLTCLVTNQQTVLNIVTGAGGTQASVINAVAKAYLQQHKGEEARKAAELAAANGEDGAEARSIAGYAYVAEGKLDEAETEFRELGSTEGMAKVALERGDLESATALADQTDTGYAKTVKAAALMREGKLEEAEAAFNEALERPADDWQRAEAVTGAGRVVHEQGNVDEAIVRYQEAVRIDPYNVVALSNEGAAHRETGELDKAAEVLERAQRIRSDDLAAMMLEQIRDDIRKANDTARRELIRNQINDLQARYAELREAGLDEPADPWSSRPLVVAFLPSEQRNPVYFERAGAEAVIQRELEARLQQDERVSVVEREMLDLLLQELNLGSSDLANPNTQLQLGRVLAAQLLGFIEYAQMDASPVMYLRLVNTETTAIDLQLVETVDSRNLGAFVQRTVDRLLEQISQKQGLQGLIADAADESAVLINLGAAHGVRAGQRFALLEEGEPITVGGRTLPGRLRPVGTLEVVEVEAEFATCRVVDKQDGLQLAREMKIRELTQP